jgi:hypothetical protein
MLRNCVFKTLPRKLNAKEYACARYTTSDVIYIQQEEEDFPGEYIKSE